MVFVVVEEGTRVVAKILLLSPRKARPKTKCCYRFVAKLLSSGKTRLMCGNPANKKYNVNIMPQ